MLAINATMMYLITKWFGTFLCDENGIKQKILFPKDEKEILKKLQTIERNEILAEEKKIAKGFEIIVQERRLQKIGTFEPLNTFFRGVDINAEEFGFTTALLHNASLLLAKKTANRKLRTNDLQIIQMINALDDLIHISNVFSERLDHWALIPTAKEKIQPFENAFSTIKNETKRLEKQIEDNMKKIAPNISKIAGPLIGARLISVAGSLERLATLPASTIQILGAEKAFFRYKKEGGKPPKHGVIFQHPLINKSMKEHRGKIARILAAKIAIAAKADAFTKRDIADNLRRVLDGRIEEIKK